MLNERARKNVFNRITNFKNHMSVEEQKTSKIESLNSKTLDKLFSLNILFF